MAINPNYLNLIGQSLALYGGLLLMVDAVGAGEFLAAIDDEDDRVRARMAGLGFVGTVNSAVVYVVVCLFGYLALVVLVPATRWLGGLIIAPFTFFAWRMSVSAGMLLQRLVDSASPAEWFKPQGCIPGIAYTVLVIPWIIVRLSAFLVAMCLEFAIDLPIRLVAERTVGPWMIRLLRSTASLQEAEKRFHFRRSAFKGFLFVLAGFFYQFLATVAQLVGA